MQERAIVAGLRPFTSDIDDTGAASPAPDPDPHGHLILLQPAGLRFRAPPGRSLLHAAEDAGIELPSSCRNGTCRTCLCQCTQGEARHLIDWPGLSAEEKAEGWILPCVAEARSDLTLDAPEAVSLFD